MASDRFGETFGRLAACFLAVASVAGLAHAGDMVWENRHLRLVLKADGTWRSIVDKHTGREYAPTGRSVPMASVQWDGVVHSASRANEEGGRLVLGFASCETRLVYQVETAEDWIAFRLGEVIGPRPERLTLICLPAAITEHVGPRLNGAWSEQYGICVRAMNLQTQGRAARRAGYAELACTTQDAPGPRVEGAAAAVLAGPPPLLRQRLQQLAVACDLPRNDDGRTPAKDLPLARGSYWFLHFGERDVEKVIEYCRRTGFRQVMLSSGAWCRTVGHFTVNTALYPDGIESLRRTVARLHAEGILVGMHTFASKVSKTDPYVTPVPDRRFWVDMSARLAQAVGPTERTLHMADDLSQWPGSPVAQQKLWEGGVLKHQEIVLDDEIIRYEAIGPPGQWNTLLGCQRGAYGTRRAAHAAGTLGRHYGVDGCINGYIIDQETTLLDETTSRLAEVFNTCDFDMVYFDGGEDVDRRRFDYYVSKCQALAMRKFRKRPLIHMGTIMTHNTWHSFTRSGTVDTYLNTLYGHIVAGGKVESWPTVRSHIDRSVAYMLSVGEDMVPGELGWFGIWPLGKNTDGLQLDEMEYLMVRSLAYDAPISLQTSFAQMESHPLLGGLLEIVSAYEHLRRSGEVPETVRQTLRQPGKDFVLVTADVFGGSSQTPKARGDRQPEAAAASSPRMTPEFVPVEPVPAVAGGREVRAMAGARGPDTIAVVWHFLGKRGVLEVRHTRLRAERLDRSAVACEVHPDRTLVPVDHRRTTLWFRDTPPAEARRLLAEARWYAQSSEGKAAASASQP